MSDAAFHQIMLDTVRAEFHDAGVTTSDLNGTHHQGSFTAACPSCDGQVTVTIDAESLAYACDGRACSQQRIVDELHYRTTGTAEAFPQPPEPSTTRHWLDGVPMNPAAETPEPVAPLPGFPFLVPKSSAVLVGPTGRGRSSLVQAAAYDAAAHGLRVAYLGHEVTEQEFQARTADLAQRRGDPINEDLCSSLATVRYLDLATVIARAWDDPTGWVREVTTRFDVVIADPLSAIASALDLDFDKSNQEFNLFYDKLVQPVVTGGTSFLTLDNVGHGEDARTRAKGASAKQDRPDLTFHSKVKAQPAGLIITAGKTRGVRVPFRRGDSWVFDRDTQRIHRETPEDRGCGNDSSPDTVWRPTILMGRITDAVQATPGLSRTAIRTTVQGNSQQIARALDFAIADGYVEVRAGGEHHVIRPYGENP